MEVSPFEAGLYATRFVSGVTKGQEGAVALGRSRRGAENNLTRNIL